MPRFIHRLLAVSAMTACGCLACAFLFFGSSNKESKMERDAGDIIKTFDEASAAEQEGDFTKASLLYAKTQEKTHAYDKAYPKEDPEPMQLVRTRCTLQIENIRFNLARQINESPVAATPVTPEPESELEPEPSAPAAQTSLTIPSRYVDDTKRPAQRPKPQPKPNNAKPPAPVAPQPTEPAMSIPHQVEWARDLMELGRFDKALENLRAVLQADPDHAGARFLYALASLQGGDTETAGTFLSDLENDAPSEAVFLLLGALRYREGNLNAALAAVRKARELNPDSAAARLNEAAILLDMPGAPRDLASAAYRQALMLGATRDPALEARLNP